jgi:organic hydroperoxide reductase OsmC/OhrA
MTISKDFRFPVSVRLEDDAKVSVAVPGLDPLIVAVPPEFHGPGGAWSPEHLLVAAAASCFAVTFAAVAERRRIPVRSLAVTATGHVGHRDDGRMGFIAIELTPRIQTDAEFVGAAERSARTVASACLVDRALSVPIEVTPVVTAVEPQLVG